MPRWFVGTWRFEKHYCGGLGMSRWTVNPFLLKMFTSLLQINSPPIPTVKLLLRLEEIKKTTLWICSANLLTSEWTSLSNISLLLPPLPFFMAIMRIRWEIRLRMSRNVPGTRKKTASHSIKKYRICKHCFTIQRITSMFPKLVYMFHTAPTKLPTDIFNCTKQS